MMIRNQVGARAAAAIPLTILLLTAWWALAPGLAGSFIFDDFANLPALGEYGPVDNAKTLLYYLTSGIADPTGRPIATLSFLIDANNWPADPAPFKRSNILLHLLNGWLLFTLLLRLGRYTTRTDRQVMLAALLGTGLWLLHPLWASTVLYVVQREAMLSGTFILLGILAYLRGRDMIAARPAAAAFWIVAGVGMCTLLALLSKPNGILLPLYIAVIEFIFLRSQTLLSEPPLALSRCLRTAIYPPVFALLAYLLYCGWRGIVFGVPSFRPWTLGQRLLTEPRVLVDYLYQLIVPHPYSRGLFNDSFPISSDWLHPWTTLPALLLIAGLIACAIAWRKRYAALALAILFYFAGQLMESSTLALELYFEHRNYVPAMLLFWPLALWLTESGGAARVKYALATCVLLLLVVETHAAATLWGETDIQALVWAAQNPDSPRAQSFAASAERSKGRYAQAEARLRKALATQPDEIQLAINLLGARCQQGSVGSTDLAQAESALRRGRHGGPEALGWVSEAIVIVRDRKCQGLTAESLKQLIEAARENRQIRDRPRYVQSLLNLEGQIALIENKAELARQKFDAALQADPRAEAALQQAALLGSNGYAQAGLEQLALYRQLAPQEGGQAIRDMGSLHAWLLYKGGYWEHEIEQMHETLIQDVHKKPIDQGSSVSD